MSTKDHIHFDVTFGKSDASDLRFGIIVSEWNEKITSALLEGAKSTLISNGADEDDIDVAYVPGSFELIYGASRWVEQDKYDAVIILGCVIRGDTPHFDYICSGVTQGIAKLNVEQETPVIFGLLTTDNMEQAEERSGGRLGNKGSECALTAIKMAKFKCNL